MILEHLNLEKTGQGLRSPKARAWLKLISQNEEFKGLWDWQVIAFDQVAGAQFSLVTAFCGSGKSFLQVCLAIDEIIRSGYTQKQLIVVPQEHIHKGFTADKNLEYQSIKLREEKYQWRVQDNFCNVSGSRVSRLIKWLLTPPAKLAKGYTGHLISGLNAVATHAALVAAWSRLTSSQKRTAIKHLSLRGDECHHVKNVLLTEEEDFDTLNRNSTGFGEICTFMINSREPTNHVHLTTATFFRSDRSYVLSKEVRSKFVEYHLPWEDHFETLGIEHFKLEWTEYPIDGSPIPQILGRIKAEPDHMHTVTVPSTGLKWRKNGDEYLDLIEELEKLFPGKVLDLITQRVQSKNKQKLLQEPKKLDENHPSQFQVIVLCQLGREGTDWCPCDRLHNASGETALTLAIQTIGRPFRRYEGKTDIVAYNYVPRFISPKKGMTKRELISDRANALLVTMMTDELINAMICPPLKSEKSKSKPKSIGLSLRTILGSDWTDVIQNVSEAIEILAPEDRTHKNLREVAEEACGRYDIDTTGYDVINGIVAFVLRFLSAPKMRPSISVSFLRKKHNFDKVMENAAQSLYFGKVTTRDFKVLRSILEGENWHDTFDRGITWLENNNLEFVHEVSV